MHKVHQISCLTLSGGAVLGRGLFRTGTGKGALTATGLPVAAPAESTVGRALLS